MKLTQHTYTNKERGFNVKIIGAGKKHVKAINVETGEKISFSRTKFEWMVNKGVFFKNEDLSEV